MDLCRIPVDSLLVTLRALVTVNILLKGKTLSFLDTQHLPAKANLTTVTVTLKDMPGLAVWDVTGFLHFWTVDTNRNCGAKNPVRIIGASPTNNTPKE
jgi:hypothetical protein